MIDKKISISIEFGIRLKQAREQKNITRKAIASLVGVHTNTYGLYERGNRAPDAIMIRTICDILQVCWPTDKRNKKRNQETKELRNSV